MTTVRITKQHVLDAIRKEPLLRSGSWVYLRQLPDDDEPVRVNDPRCAVCAVGAVMRNVIDASAPYLRIDDAAKAATDHAGRVTPAWDYDDDYKPVDPATTTIEQALEEADEGEHMAALSTYFEGQVALAETELGRGAYDFTYADWDVIRARVLAFVGEHFPDTLDVEIDGAPPAPGVEVVHRNW
jgi:hypothetical protein